MSDADAGADWQPPSPVSLLGLARTVRRLRERNGMTEHDLAAMVPCSVSVIREIEGGTRTPWPWVLPRLASALEVSMGALFGPPQSS